MKHYMKRYFPFGVILIVGMIFSVFIIDDYVQRSGLKYIVSADEVPKVDAILILGAYVFPDGTVSFMLDERLHVGDELYKKGKADKLIVSGDHGQEDYDEVNAMKKYLMDKNIPPEFIFMDHAGFNTYDSIYRARDIFGAKKIIIVTQKYHLMRAIFIAREFGLEAYGVPCEYGEVEKIYKRREIAARNKDFFLAKIIKPKPVFLGDAIPLTGDGKITDDKRK